MGQLLNTFSCIAKKGSNHHTDMENIGLDSAYKIMFLEQPEFKGIGMGGKSSFSQFSLILLSFN